MNHSPLDPDDHNQTHQVQNGKRFIKLMRKLLKIIY